MVCKTRGKGSYGNSPTQDQRKEPKPENNFKKKEKAISLCPNQLNHTIKGASSIGNSTYCELTTELYTHTHTHTHTLSLEPVWALIFLTGRGGLDTTFKKKKFILAVLCGVWDLSFLTRDWTQVSAVKAPNPNHWTTREFPRHLLKLKQDMSPTSFQSTPAFLPPWCQDPPAYRQRPYD